MGRRVAKGAWPSPGPDPAKAACEAATPACAIRLVRRTLQSATRTLQSARRTVRPARRVRQIRGERPTPDLEGLGIRRDSFAPRGEPSTPRGGHGRSGAKGPRRICAGPPREASLPRAAPGSTVPPGHPYTRTPQTADSKILPKRQTRLFDNRCKVSSGADETGLFRSARVGEPRLLSAGRESVSAARVPALDVLLHSSPQLREGAKLGRGLEQGPVDVLGGEARRPPDYDMAVLLVLR